ncbi:hypothetical protein SeHB_A4653 [Salmonella enterica subsp. enterica serovar Heidelberg str. SL486]|nr:hypothetical protein SeHB_A4653 [Salmonella enterica subsp. enterica serovar Heidelberg str. SL486]EHC84454.1 hypothetical protein LTSEUGA_6042 [Salmonella enterica subsp. enterica serovar Uganda str. R8-3404]
MLRLYLLKIPFSSVPFQHCEARRKINPVICNAHAFSELNTQNTSLRALPLSL